VDDPLLVFAGRVVLAALLGVAIGLERQLHHHAAGPRTNGLVSLGAAMFVSLTALLNDTTSPSRIASYIVSGIGFLGGGAILKEGANVRGLTTAAVLWCSAAVGALSGTGHGGHAVVGTGIVMGLLIGMRPIVEWIDRHNQRAERVVAEYRLAVVCAEETHPVVRALLDQHLGPASGFRLTAIKTGKSKRRKSIVVRVAVTTMPANDPVVQGFVDRLLAEPGVRSASWEKSTHALE
jgi:putative Mg2+ transporter-C (MgtC) family protein